MFQVASSFVLGTNQFHGEHGLHLCKYCKVLVLQRTWSQCCKAPGSCKAPKVGRGECGMLCSVLNMDGWQCACLIFLCWCLSAFIAASLLWGVWMSCNICWTCFAARVWMFCNICWACFAARVWVFCNICWTCFAAQAWMFCNICWTCFAALFYLFATCGEHDLNKSIYNNNNNNSNKHK